MASFPCPYCGQAVAASATDDPTLQCESCDGGLQLAYRYSLVAERGTISAGLLYEAVDDIFGEKVAVLFVAEPDDPESVARFCEGNRLFAELGGGRGLVKIREIASPGHRRPYVIMDWITSGTLDSVVRKHGALDQATLLETIGDILTGLAKAHRAMPSIVHGHIHPGKIGYLDNETVVLLGFEWARQVFEQDSHLADDLVEGQEDTGADRASDLRQLGVALFYAATGEWLGDQTQAQRRARARARLSGPLATFIERMLGAGTGGYRSAVNALIDFDDLLRGSSIWQTRPQNQQDRSDDLSAAAWRSDDLASRHDPYEANKDVEQLSDDDIEAEDFDEALGELFASEAGPPPSRRSHPATPAANPFDAARQQALRQQLDQARQPTAKPGRIAGIVIAVSVGMGMCVAAIESEDKQESRVEVKPPPPPVYEPAVPVPEPEPRWQPPDPITEPLPDIERAPGTIDGVHHYRGQVAGPADVSGLALGEPCDVWVEPDGPGSCKWYIDCGQPRRRIYGGGNVGYSSCEVEDGHPTLAQDEDQDAPDGAFMAVLSDVDPMVMVQDRWLLPPTRVLISIESGGNEPRPGPIPNVPGAARMTRAAIEQAMDRGALPSFEPGSVAEPKPEADPDVDCLLDPNLPKCRPGGSDPEPDDSELPVRPTNAALREVLQQSATQLRSCASGEGNVSVALTIQGNGNVSEISLTPEPGAAAKACIIRVMRRARFPAFTGPEIPITWQLTL